MGLLVVGSIGIDTVETPSARRVNQLGGSAVYFAYASSLYAKTHLVSVVGKDFPKPHRQMLEKRKICLEGLEVVPDGKTFRWSGKYHEDMNNRDTLEVDLNVLGTFDPKVPASYRSLDYLFLANASPAVQHKTLKQMKKRPKFVGMDTMDLWIEIARKDLDALLKDVDALILNDGEARKLTDKKELLSAGKAIQKLGPKIVIIKKGEHGALVLMGKTVFTVPAYPLEEVIDPTGAGDSFAGAIMGYLTASKDVSPKSLRRAVAHGSVVASFTVQGFSLEALKKAGKREIQTRYKGLLDLTRIPE